MYNPSSRLEFQPADETAAFDAVSGANETGLAQDSLKNQRPDETFGEWQQLPQEDWNIHQRIAERTGGWVTAANAVSVIGGLLTATGVHCFARGQRTSGLAMAASGRLLDLADGVVARRLGTRSKAGAATDAGIDKLLAAQAMVELTKSGTIPPRVAIVTAAQQARITAENVVIERRGGQPNPSKEGKLYTAGIWAATGMRAVEHLLRERGSLKTATAIGRMAAGVEIATLDLGEQTIDGYRTQRKSLPK